MGRMFVPNTKPWALSNHVVSGEFITSTTLLRELGHEDQQIRGMYNNIIMAKKRLNLIHYKGLRLDSNIFIADYIRIEIGGHNTFKYNQFHFKTMDLHLADNADECPDNMVSIPNISIYVRDLLSNFQILHNLFRGNAIYINISFDKKLYKFLKHEYFNHPVINFIKTKNDTREVGVGCRTSFVDDMEPL
jgi:hypothetical protein